LRTLMCYHGLSAGRRKLAPIGDQLCEFVSARRAAA
jgi:hypothetical protein